MKIVYEDGGELNCHKVVIAGGKVYADDLYDIAVADVKEIVDE